jgi:putative transposase
MVTPGTLSRWHRRRFRLFWRWRSTPRGRPRVPADLRRLISAMAEGNPTWGEERITAEFLVKLGIRVSPRTVRRYLPKGTGTGTASVPNAGVPLYGTTPMRCSSATSAWR